MPTTHNKVGLYTMPVGGVCPEGYALGADGYCYRVVTSHTDTHPGLGIKCNDETIYCDSEDYYCDGSVVMRNVNAGLVIRCNDLTVLCNSTEIDCNGAELHRKVSY